MSFCKCFADVLVGLDASKIVFLHFFLFPTPFSQINIQKARFQPIHSSTIGLPNLRRVQNPFFHFSPPTFPQDLQKKQVPAYVFFKKLAFLISHASKDICFHVFLPTPFRQKTSLKSGSKVRLTYSSTIGLPNLRHLQDFIHFMSFFLKKTSEKSRFQPMYSSKNWPS